MTCWKAGYTEVASLRQQCQEQQRLLEQHDAAKAGGNSCAQSGCTHQQEAAELRQQLLQEREQGTATQAEGEVRAAAEEVAAACLLELQAKQQQLDALQSKVAALQAALPDQGQAKPAGPAEQEAERAEPLLAAAEAGAAESRRQLAAPEEALESAAASRIVAIGATLRAGPMLQLLGLEQKCTLGGDAARQLSPLLRLMYSVGCYGFVHGRGKPRHGEILYVQLPDLVDPAASASGEHTPVVWLHSDTGGVGTLYAQLGEFDSLLAAQLEADMRVRYGNHLLSAVFSLPAAEKAMPLSKAILQRVRGGDFDDTPAAMLASEKDCTQQLKAALRKLRLKVAAGRPGALPPLSQFVAVKL
ncbi:hypothetical protein ABPG75_003178 [Micractinium tetrahymenae]